MFLFLYNRKTIVLNGNIKYNYVADTIYLEEVTYEQNKGIDSK